MKLSLFKKYLIITMGIIVVAFIILGLFLMAFVTQYWTTREKNQVEDSIENISELVSSCMETSNGSLWISERSIWEQVIELSNSYNYDIIVTDSDGVVFKTTRRDDVLKRGYQISNDVMVPLIKNNTYKEEDYTGHFYDDTKISMASPLRVAVGLTTTTAGYMFVCSSNEMSDDAPLQVAKILLYAVVASLIVSVVLAGLFSYSQTYPLKQMSLQARKFAKGDFTGRLPVAGHDEIAQLTKSFNDMADALEKEESVRRDFIANISHELKTPMTTISGFIDGILDGTIPPVKQNHYLEIVSEEIGRLSRLVASMLSLARIDSGKTQLYKTDFMLAETMVNILTTFEDRLIEKNITIAGLETADGIQVHGDQTLMHQVLYNLFENATKFTPQDGIITFKFEVNDNRLYFSIKNTGKGIAKEDLPFIFDKFYKTDKSRSEDKKSMGLGLYIVKTIITLHGGEIVVTSDVDRETCFSAWIPEK
ncbi:MAG: HAMP domain-containing sensor histidine kinase [Ruminococcus sp.]|nr:HAMP domain-containing sensor histidine kinase [Ruminococcus sp.]